MAEMPIHPMTGLSAIGFTRRGPIWPVMGGAPDDGGNDGGNGGSDNGGAGGNGGDGGDDKKFTQADIDRIVQSRLGQERNQVAQKYGNLDELLTAKGELDQIKNKDKPEVDQLRSQLTAVTTRAEQAESRATSSDVELLKFRVAAGVEGFPIGAVSRLQGTTEDEIKADAEKFLADFGGVNNQQQGPRPPKPNLQQGNSSGNGDGDKSVSAGADLYSRMHPKKSTTTQ
ncbi:hypothetical protein [Gordonia sp. ABSL49_1]|uniref:hypothetical protein n=1 Tax=Gordonia sp. ABSL49_1 TaxID=2920941 RepID=UPI001F0E38C7|nr:hypothetical protein [Gordonia sp. ABSL49_1]MCH5645155.1 hypothetical protein [Gordonia sp. ABSL49_1]